MQPVQLCRLFCVFLSSKFPSSARLVIVAPYDLQSDQRLFVLPVMLVLIEAWSPLSHQAQGPAGEPCDRKRNLRALRVVAGLYLLRRGRALRPSSGASCRRNQRIGTAYLRLDLLPSAAQPALRQLFRDYADSPPSSLRRRLRRDLPRYGASTARDLEAVCGRRCCSWNKRRRHEDPPSGPQHHESTSPPPGGTPSICTRLKLSSCCSSSSAAARLFSAATAWRFTVEAGSTCLPLPRRLR